MSSNNSDLPEQGKLGRDLPETEDQLFQLAALPILNTKMVENIFKKGWKADLVELGNAFLDTLPTEKKLIETAHAKHNWEQINTLAHKMKGGCVYIGTQRLAVACQYLERYLKSGHNQHTEHLYQQMIDVMDDTVPVLKNWLLNH